MATLTASPGLTAQSHANPAGSTADGLTLFERLEGKLEAHPGQLRRAAVELAKAWRQDRVLRHLQARGAGAGR